VDPMKRQGIPQRLPNLSYLILQPANITLYNAARGLLPPSNRGNKVRLHWFYEHNVPRGVNLYDPKVFDTLSLELQNTLKMLEYRYGAFVCNSGSPTFGNWFNDAKLSGSSPLWITGPYTAHILIELVRKILINRGPLTGRWYALVSTKADKTVSIELVSETRKMSKDEFESLIASKSLYFMPPNMLTCGYELGVKFSKFAKKGLLKLDICFSACIISLVETGSFPRVDERIYTSTDHVEFHKIKCQFCQTDILSNVFGAICNNCCSSKFGFGKLNYETIYLKMAERLCPILDAHFETVVKLFESKYWRKACEFSIFAQVQAQRCRQDFLESCCGICGGPCGFARYVGNGYCVKLKVQSDAETIRQILGLNIRTTGLVTLPGKTCPADLWGGETARRQLDSTCKKIERLEIIQSQFASASASDATSLASASASSASASASDATS